METNNKVAGVVLAQTNNKVSKEDEWLKDKPLFDFDEIEQEFKNKKTKIHVVLKKIENGIVIDKQDVSFLSEDEADSYSETLAISLSSLPLDFWEYSYSDIAVHYSLTDTDNPKIKYRITIYPKNFNK